MLGHYPYHCKFRNSSSQDSSTHTKQESGEIPHALLRDPINGNLPATCSSKINRAVGGTKASETQPTAKESDSEE